MEFEGVGFEYFETELEEFEVRKIGRFERAFKVGYGGSLGNHHEIKDGIVYLGARDFYVYAVEAEEGNEIWRFKTGGKIYSSPSIWKEKIYFGSWDCHFYCVDPEGSEIWRFRTSTLAQSPIPHAYEMFEVVIKKSISEDEMKREEKYEFTSSEAGTESEYSVKTEYAMKSEYKQESGYK